MTGMFPTRVPDLSAGLQTTGWAEINLSHPHTCKINNLPKVSGAVVHFTHLLWCQNEGSGQTHKAHNTTLANWTYVELFSSIRYSSPYTLESDIYKNNYSRCEQFQPPVMCVFIRL